MLWKMFDAPDAFSTCTRRNRSNTPLQALTLLNDAAFVDLADQLAQRLQTGAGGTEPLAYGFQLCTGRRPKPVELERLLRILDGERRAGSESEAWRTVARVLLNLDETITRE